MSGVSDRLTQVVGEQRLSTLKQLGHWAVRSYLIMVILGIVIGLQVAPIVSDYTEEEVSGTVAIVPLEGGIDGQNAASLAARLKQARSSPSIDAVVLRVSSPGGGASASETMYFEVRRTAQQMPVVTSVNSMAASGGYYAAVPSDEIFVNPSTLIGSVGVITVAPQSLDPLDELITSGPDKLTGSDRREWFHKIESIKRAFVGAVVHNREEQLELSREEVAYAKLYSGSEAVSNGMADRIGGIDAAIKRAASMAGLTRYNVKVIGYDDTVSFLTRSNYVASDAPDKEIVPPSTMITKPSNSVAPNVLMLPRSVVRAAIAGTDNVTGVTANATIAG